LVLVANMPSSGESVSPKSTPFIEGEVEESKPKTTAQPTPVYLLPWKFLVGTFRLFFQRKFGFHRMTGLCYLIQYAIVIWLFFYDYEAFLQSNLIITLPLTGILQTIVAIYTFTFLPANTTDPGYYSDKGILSYPFIKENLFFVGLLGFQWLYYNDRCYPIFKTLWPLECLFVFLPYVFRFLFPKTHMRDSLKSMKNTTEKNSSYYFYATWLTKIFYVWAKHYIGFFLNYIRYVDKVNEYDQKCVFLLLIAACFATTIAMFLHTLRFKHYLDPVTAFTLYVIGYMSTFIGYGMIFHMFFTSYNLFVITFVGLVLNLVNNDLFNVYQIGVMMAFLTGRV